MPRADLIENLVRAGTRGDQALFRQVAEALVAEERAKQHHVFAERLAKYLSNGTSSSGVSTRIDERVQNLFFEITPTRSLKDLILPENVLVACQELVEECNRSELLRSHNLEPRHRILLAGPPGNGKTSLAEAVAESLMIPLIVVRYEGVIGSYLGETANRLHRIFEYARTRHCVLFFDEFDTLGKERGDLHETGEIKRVVSSLLLQMDRIPSHVIVITASNHPELLDRAVWRRFQLRLFLPGPERKQIEEWFNRFDKKFGMRLDYPVGKLATALNGLSFAELEDFSEDISRRYVLSLPGSNLNKIVGERLEQWRSRFSLKR